MNHPIDLPALQLIRLVAKHRSFSAAAAESGISQSALSRQISNAENRLGIKLFERTTRRVAITEAGAILVRETAAIPNLLNGALRRIKEECLQARPKVRVCLSTELSQAHIAGIFNPTPGDAQIIVSRTQTPDLISSLGQARYDLGILAAPEILPDDLLITHRMNDRFIVIAPSSHSGASILKNPDCFSWILPPMSSPARDLINRSFPKLSASMELESFDQMVQFVALGLGCAFVPRRTVSSFPRKKLIHKIPPPTPINRSLIVAIPKHLKPTEHVQRFIEGILFS